MNAWLIAVVALLPPAAIGFAAGLRGGAPARLVAVQFAAAVTVFILVLMSFAFDQESVIDLALATAFLALPGTLLFAHALERWL